MSEDETVVAMAKDLASIGVAVVCWGDGCWRMHSKSMSTISLKQVRKLDAADFIEAIYEAHAMLFVKEPRSCGRARSR